MMLLFGDYLEKNQQEALVYFMKASKVGDSTAMCNLGKNKIK